MNRRDFLFSTLASGLVLATPKIIVDMGANTGLLRRPNEFDRHIQIGDYVQYRAKTNIAANTMSELSAQGAELLNYPTPDVEKIGIATCDIEAGEYGWFFIGSGAFPVRVVG